MRTVTRVEYLIPGTIVSENGSYEVQSRDLRDALAELPEYAFAFRFVDLTYLNATDEQGNTFETKPTRSNETGWHYPGGSVYDLATIRELDAMHPDGEYRILRANMEGNGYEQVVQTRRGNWQPFRGGNTSRADQLVSA
jgi:hypothetical protein